MSSPRSSSGTYRKPRPDIYTVLLAISLVAIIIACVFLYLETADYPESPPWSGGPTVYLPVEKHQQGTLVVCASSASPLFDLSTSTYGGSRSALQVFWASVIT